MPPQDHPMEQDPSILIDSSIDRFVLENLTEKSLKPNDPLMSRVLLKNNLILAEKLFFTRLDPDNDEALTSFNKDIQTHLLTMFRFMPVQVVDELVALLLKQNIEDEKKARLTKLHSQVKKDFLASGIFYARNTTMAHLSDLLAKYHRKVDIPIAEVATNDLHYGRKKEKLAKKLYSELLKAKKLSHLKPKTEAFLELPPSSKGSRAVAVLMEKIALWLSEERRASKDPLCDLFKTLRSQLPGYGINKLGDKTDRKLFCGYYTPFDDCNYDWAIPLVDAVYYFSNAKDIHKEPAQEGFKYHLLHEVRTGFRPINTINRANNFFSHGLLAITSTWKEIEDLFESIWQMNLLTPNLSRALKGQNSYEKNISQFYIFLSQFLWLTGNTQALLRGTGTVVEILFAILHYRQYLKLPLLQLAFSQLDVLDLTFPKTDYMALFPYFFEPSTISKHLLGSYPTALYLLTAKEQIQFLYHKLNEEHSLMPLGMSIADEPEYEMKQEPLYESALGFRLEVIHNLILIAAAQNRVNLINILVLLDGDFTIKNEDGFAAIHMAACHGATEVVSTLVTIAKVDINSTTEDGRTPVYIACQNKRLAVLFSLAKLGADLHKPNAKGLSPLDVAACNGEIDIARFLIKHSKLRFSQIVISHNKALHHALFQKHWKVVLSLVLSLGEKAINLKNKHLLLENRTALLQLLQCEDMSDVTTNARELHQLENVLSSNASRNTQPAL
jgi:ankyrin repeat protein